MLNEYPDTGMENVAGDYSDGMCTVSIDAALYPANTTHYRFAVLDGSNPTGLQPIGGELESCGQSVQTPIPGAVAFLVEAWDADQLPHVLLGRKVFVQVP